MLKPVVRLCLRHGIHFQEFNEAAKRVFVEQAGADIAGEAGSSNISRISAATGLQRKDIRRLLDEPESETAGLLARVIGQWQLDKKFTNAAGKPRKLQYGGKVCEFTGLVRKISSDLNSGTILLELERLGAVTRTKTGLTLNANVLSLKGDVRQGMLAASRESAALFQAVEENTAENSQVPNLHATTEFTNIRQSSVPAIRAWLFDEGSKLHSRARAYLSQFDNDITSAEDPAAVTVLLTTFSLTKLEEQPVPAESRE